VIKEAVAAAALIAISPQVTSASARMPSTLKGVIVFSCVWTQRGSKVDEQIFKIDFVNRTVNDIRVKLTVDQEKIHWSPGEKDGPWNYYGTHWINRYSGKLEGLTDQGIEVYFCHIAGKRKF
jgi:hypothetical protein